MKKLLISLCILPLLTACPSTAIMTGASIVSFVNTDKFLGDHVATAITGEDCSALYVEQDGSYCKKYVDQNAKALAELENAPYCYETLGDITCYDRPDPYTNSRKPIR